MPRAAAVVALLGGVWLAAVGVWHELTNPAYVHPGVRPVTPMQEVALGAFLIAFAVVGFLTPRKPSSE